MEYEFAGANAAAIRSADNVFLIGVFGRSIAISVFYAINTNGSLRNL